MENIYLALVIVLFILAISDLVVGVSNDAVNFLNSAIGAKAAPFWIIMAIAGLGVLFGATFSSGMMEIARSGIFHPDKFYFSEIMLIFLAVMITDVILLDTFNTFGLPTSTTVSIVFELLGASVAIAMMKLYESDSGLSMGDYINTSKALAIISGILLSVVIAFSVGALIQFFTRWLFSFRFEKRMRYFGALYGGFAITAIIYFMLIKGVKGASFITDDVGTWIKSNSFLIIMVSFVSFTALLQLFNWLFKLNILKTVVLAGTFALAMAFAGNDLVNFIGVPLAGFESFKTLINNPGADPDFLLMSSLKGKVQTPTLFLLLAGLVMVVTLFTSRKAKSVVKTTIDLSRQDEGDERFSSSQLSRTIVRMTIKLSERLSSIIPDRLKNNIDKQFALVSHDKNEKDYPAFDMLRASVNLVVASILIALGTSLKLPLSTTYVTFMVAMGTSLSDRAWDRESAVYRVTGVFSVIGGWFFTALSAFTVAFLIALFFYFGNMYAIGIMVLISIYLVYRTHKIHTSREASKAESNKGLEQINNENILEQCSLSVNNIMHQTQLEYKKTIAALSDFDVKALKKIAKTTEKIEKDAKHKKNSVTIIIAKLKEDALESGHYYVQVLDYLREILHSLNFIVNPVYTHISNNHKEFSKAQLSELKILSQHLGNFFTHITSDIKDGNFSNQENISAEQQKFLNLIDLFRKNEVKRIKKEAGSTRNSLLFMTILQETKNLGLFSFNLYKSQRDFMLYHTEKNNKA
ncbi:MAG: inorganic phosphate transporter [Bacteroidales bacterium]|nr:inorganic phosphate transporter [Bacteroidales bacterium]